MQFVKTRNRRLKFWFNLFLAYLSRYKFTILGIIVALFALTYSSTWLLPKITRSNIVTIGYVGNYTIDTIPAQVLSLATQPLITTDENGHPKGDLASHWTVSDDGKTYVVFLKDNLRWHDDTQVDAKDITIAIKNVRITALNNKAIEFQLPNPISSFPLALDKPVFKAKTFYGTGAFRITDIKKSEDTIQKISMTPKDPNLPRVEIKFYQTEGQLQNAIKIGDVKSASVANAKIIESWPNLHVEKRIDNREVLAIFFNNQDQLLGSKELREALSYAINKSNFDGQSAFSPISPDSWAYSTDVKRYEYNTGKAKELLSKSQVQNPKITLSVVGGFNDVAKSVQKDWNDLGVPTEIKEEKAVPQDFQALLVIEKIPEDPDQYGLWHSTQTATNITHFNSKKVDKILEDARITPDEDQRKKLYSDFQGSLMDEAPLALLYHPYKYQVVYKNIENLVSKLTSAQSN